ncbi:MAG: Nif3-like dinuclear metal center hexameric protein [Marinilabiliales bacterium]|nr:MAG: Nif3-like dinuclear metal center hexameric protein [Marinilabiliales bacterium]
MKHAQIFEVLEEFAPPAYQEDYDNSGIITGSYSDECKGAIITLDVTDEVIDEAIETGANLVIAHHPLIFKGLKKIIPGNAVTDPLIKAIKHEITIYAIHTNLDNVSQGVNRKLCEVLGIDEPVILVPGKGALSKLVTFVPEAHAEMVRKAMFSAGAGKIGNYDNCSFNSIGEGTFQAGEGTNPFVGEQGKTHTEKETRIEVVFPSYLKSKIIAALIKSHPYEEVAYDIYALENHHPGVGAGMIGNLEKPLPASEFFNFIKEKLNLPGIKYTGDLKTKVRRVALCGGSGSFLMNAARRANADIFITGDIKYHDYFEAGKKMIVADIGHYESEQFTKELLFEVLKEKIPTFALSISKVNTNPVKYL